ncbi:hypothetical protein D3C78_629210 [compost metagenome]
MGRHAEGDGQVGFLGQRHQRHVVVDEGVDAAFAQRAHHVAEDVVGVAAEGHADGAVEGFRQGHVEAVGDRADALAGEIRRAAHGAAAQDHHRLVEHRIGFGEVGEGLAIGGDALAAEQQVGVAGLQGGVEVRPVAVDELGWPAEQAAEQARNVGLVAVPVAGGILPEQRRGGEVGAQYPEDVLAHGRYSMYILLSHSVTTEQKRAHSSAFRSR